MMFGKDFFKILKLVFAFLKLFTQIFGDEEDRDNGHDFEIPITKDKSL